MQSTTDFSSGSFMQQLLTTLRVETHLRIPRVLVEVRLQRERLSVFLAARGRWRMRRGLNQAWSLLTDY